MTGPRTVRFASYQLPDGSSMVVASSGAPSSVRWTGKAWEELPSGQRRICFEEFELHANDRDSLLRRLFDVLLQIPEGPEAVVAAVRTNITSLDARDGGLWFVTLGLLALPDARDVGEGIDDGVLPLPSWIRLEPDFMDCVGDSLVVDGVMES